jgi:hypothetical protein
MAQATSSRISCPVFCTRTSSPGRGSRSNTRDQPVRRDAGQRGAGRAGRGQHDSGALVAASTAGPTRRRRRGSAAPPRGGGSPVPGVASLLHVVDDLCHLATQPLVGPPVKTGVLAGRSVAAADRSLPTAPRVGPWRWAPAPPRHSRHRSHGPAMSRVITFICIGAWHRCRWRSARGHPRSGVAGRGRNRFCGPRPACSDHLPNRFGQGGRHRPTSHADDGVRVDDDGRVAHSNHLLKW